MQSVLAHEHFLLNFITPFNVCDKPLYILYYSLFSSSTISLKWMDETDRFQGINKNPYPCFLGKKNSSIISFGVTWLLLNECMLENDDIVSVIYKETLYLQ